MSRAFFPFALVSSIPGTGTHTAPAAESKPPPLPPLDEPATEPRR